MRQRAPSATTKCSVPAAPRTAQLASSSGSTHRRDRVLVVLADLRRLVARHQWGSVVCLIAVLHAPSLHADPEAGSLCWADTAAALRRLRRDGEPLVILTDANARVGSASSPSVGAAHADDEGQAGVCFHALLREQDLFLPHTFEEYLPPPPRDHGTWRNSIGQWRRIDYVALPLAWRASTRAASVDLGVHLAIGTKEDHRPVSADVGLRLRSAPPAARAPFDRALLRLPACADAIRAC